jgi:UDP-glucose 4-epimerase
VKLLVTGSSGQIGSYVVDIARRRGHETMGLDMESDGGNRTDLVGDIRDGELVERAIEDSEAVIHCAAQISVEKSLEDPAEDTSHNVLGTVNLLDAASQHELEARFVNVSSAAVYGDPAKVPISEDDPTEPLAPYGQSKLATEGYADLFRRTQDLDIVNVRPFNVYSPRQDSDNPYSGVISIFADRIADGKPPLLDGDGEQTRDFVHAEDVARWMVKIAEPETTNVPKGWSAINLGSGRETSIVQLAETMIEAAGKAGELEPKHREPRPGDIRRSLADRSRADKLGLGEETDLFDGLEGIL